MSTDVDPAEAGEALAHGEDPFADDSIREELNTILPGSEPMQNIHVEHQGGKSYVVLSVRDGSPSFYHVTLGSSPSCTCPDFEYNRDSDANEVCKHVCAAVLAPRMSLEETGGQIMLESLTRLNNAVDDARAAAEGLTEARINELSNRPYPDEQVPENDKPGTYQAGGSSGPDAEEKREQLQEAFDDATKGMKTMVADGKIWINKSPDAPDWTFDAFLRNADQVWYEPDDAPAEYYQNSILPKNVDSYIEEVLK